MNKITKTKNHIKNLPIDVKMFFLCLVGIPVFLSVLTIIHLFSPFALTPEMLPGLFDSTGNLKVANIFQTICLMITLFFGLVRGGQDGGVGICVAALGYAGLMQFFS